MDAPLPFQGPDAAAFARWEVAAGLSLGPLPEGATCLAALLDPGLLLTAGPGGGARVGVDGLAALVRAAGRPVHADMSQALLLSLPLGVAGRSELLQRALDPGPDWSRSQVLAVVARHGEEAHVPGVLRALQDVGDAEAREMAWRALGQIGGEAAVRALTLHPWDAYQDVDGARLEAVARAGAIDALEAALPGLSAGPARDVAARLLEARAGRGDLAPLLASAPWAGAAVAWAEVAPPVAEALGPHLAGALVEASDDALPALIRAVSASGDAARPALTDALANGVGSDSLVLGLAALPSPDPALLGRFLHHEDPRVRTAAALGLARRGARVPALAAALRGDVLAGTGWWEAVARLGDGVPLLRGLRACFGLEPVHDDLTLLVADPIVAPSIRAVAAVLLGVHRPALCGPLLDRLSRVDAPGERDVRAACAAGTLLAGHAPAPPGILARLLLQGDAPSAGGEGELRTHAGGLAVAASLDPDPGVRRAALGLLGTLPSVVVQEHAALLAIPATRDDHPQVRDLAWALLPDTWRLPGHGDALADALVPAVDDVSPRVSALRRLERARSPLAARIALSWLASGVSGASGVEAARIVGAHAEGDRVDDVISAGVGALGREDPEARLAGCTLLGAIPRARWPVDVLEEVVEVLGALARHDGWDEVRRSAGAALVALGEPVPTESTPWT